MSMKLGASSGTYNVRASELARNKPVTKSIRCVVRFLDDSEAIFEIDVSIIIHRYRRTIHVGFIFSDSDFKVILKCSFKMRESALTYILPTCDVIKYNTCFHNNACLTSWRKLSQ